MTRNSTLLASCGRGPIVAVAIAAGVAFGLGLLASTLGHGPSGHAIQPVQEGQEGGWGDMDPEAMAEMMAQLGAPGEQHEELKVFVGQWDTRMEALAEGMEAFNSTGTATFEPVMGGRFIKQDYTGTFMGAPMRGVGLSGYNNASKQYEGVWYDSMSTALYVVKGEKTDTGWVYEGEEVDPMSGETFGFRHVIAMDGKDNWHFTMQYPPERSPPAWACRQRTGPSGSTASASATRGRGPAGVATRATATAADTRANRGQSRTIVPTSV